MIENSLLVDKPARKTADDRLHRAPFAKLIAEAIANAPKEDARVFAINGAYGTGKSTVAHFVEEYVGHRANVVWFEPWMIGSPDALAREFFLTLGRAALGSGAENSGNARRELFYRYAAQVLDVTSTTAEAISSLGVPFAGLVKNAADKTKPLVNAAAEGLKTLSNQPSLRESRDRIAKALLGLEKPTLMIVDDIDRLDDDEIQTLFRIVKACADLPNVRYLLLFDRRQVEKALGSRSRDGAIFLEKIVSAVFDLPQVTRDDRESLLNEAIRSLIKEDLDSDASKRIGLVYENVLLPGLPTVRAVKRYFSAAAALLPGLCEQGVLQVDPGDFFALEYIRQREPEYYGALLAEEDPLPGGRYSRMFIERKEEDGPLTRALPDDETRRRLLEAARDVLKSETQTRRREVFGGGETGHYRARRFASSLWKPNYFGFSATRTPLTDKEWNSLVSAVREEEARSEVFAFDVLDDLERRDSLVRAIVFRISGLDDHALEAMLRSVFRWGEAHTSDDPTDYSEFNQWWRAASDIGSATLYELSLRGGTERAVEAFRKAGANTSGVVVPAVLIGFAQLGLRSGSGLYGWLDHESLQVLVTEYKERLAQIFRSGAVWQVPDSEPLVATWAFLMGQEAFDEWRLSLASDPKALTGYLERVISNYQRLGHEQSFAVTKEDPLLPAIAALPDEDLSERGRWAKKAYLKYGNYQASA